MSQLPPAVRESEFLAIDTVDEDEILRKFGPFVRKLHSFLNQLHCLHDIQQTRQKWRTQVQYKEAFGTFATEPRHWYTFNNGGRNEAQYNIGLFPTYLRVGLGFEFTQKKGGDPNIVGLAYACFKNVIDQDSEGFRQFVHENLLEVEWELSVGNPKLVPTEQVVQWLRQPPQASWVFVGRLLRRGKDTMILEDPLQLKHTIESVFNGFRPIWEQTQIMAKKE